MICCITPVFMSQAYLKHMELVVFTYQNKKAWTIKNKITFRHINQLCESYPAFYMAPKKSTHYIVESRLWGGHSEPVFNKKIYIYTGAGFPQRTP